ncbi:hypothetical protein NL676_013915 [Syzygium grande]|nr:hypothetical protein NL676_013915 [Syzygium grande]
MEDHTSTQQLKRAELTQAASTPTMSNRPRPDVLEERSDLQPERVSESPLLLPSSDSSEKIHVPLAYGANSDPSASSTSAIGNNYHVFLSFRGPDTRNGFVDHLYHKLKDVVDHLYHKLKDVGLRFHPNISFRDDEDLPFNAFRRRKDRFDKEVKRQGKEALKKVLDLRVFESEKFASGHEAKLVKELVESVLREQQGDFQPRLPENLVAVDDSVAEVMKLMDTARPDAPIVGIHGIGGIELWLAECYGLKELDGLEALKSLRVLRLCREWFYRLGDLDVKADHLHAIGGLEKLGSLEVLNISGRKHIQVLDLSKLEHLKELDVRNCKSLVEIRCPTFSSRVTNSMLVDCCLHQCEIQSTELIESDSWSTIESCP